MVTQTHRTDFKDTGCGRRGWHEWREYHENIYTTICKQIPSGNLLYGSGNSNWGSVTTSRAEVGWEVGGRFRRKRACAYLWVIHADVWQRPTQCCKAIILP